MIPTKKEQISNLTYGAFAIVCFGWGSTWVGSKVAIKYIPALQMAGMRQIVGAILILTISLFVFKKISFPKEVWPRVFTFSIINFIGANGLSTWGVEYINSGIASLLGALYPFWVIVFISILNKKIDINKWAIIGILLGIIGVGIVFYPKIISGQHSSLFGLFLSISASICWAIGTIYTQKQAKNVNTYVSIGWQMLISGVILNLVTYLIHHFTDVKNIFIPYHLINPAAILPMSYLLIIGNLITFAAYIYALQRMPAAQLKTVAKALNYLST